MKKRWSVKYSGSAKGRNRRTHSRLMPLWRASDFLKIFEDALYIERFIRWPHFKIKRHSLIHDILIAICLLR